MRFGKSNRHLRIDAIYNEMVHSIRAEVDRRGLSGRQLAVMAGISEASARQVLDRNARPSIKNAAACDDALFSENEGGELGRKLLAADPELARRAVLGVDRRTRAQAYLCQVLLDPHFVPAVEPRQLGPAVRYLDSRINSETLTDTVKILNRLAPNCATHLFVADGQPENWFAQIWDNSTQFQGGEDLTGIKVRENQDPLFVDVLVEDYVSVARSGAPRFSLIERRPDGGEARSYLRYMKPLKDADGFEKIVILTAPQEHGLYLDIVGDFGRGRPQDG